MRYTYKRAIPVIESVTYSINVPFHRSCTIAEYTMIANDTIAPVTGVGQPSELWPEPGYGALYRLIGDGTHTPTFSATFKKSSGSGDYVNILGVVNLVSFIFDGVDYWYSIIQAQ